MIQRPQGPRSWTVLTLGLVSAIAVADSLAEGAPDFILLAIAGPLLAAVRNGPRRVLPVAAYAFLLAVAAETAHGPAVSPSEYRVRGAGVLFGGGLAVVAARLRQRLEGRLRGGEEGFRESFDEAPVGMGLVAVDGRWLRVNRALRELLGGSAEEPLTLQDVLHAEDLDAGHDLLRRVLAGEVRHAAIETRLVSGAGRVVNVLLGVSLVRDSDGEPLHFITQVQDITERRRLEEERERLLEGLMEALRNVKTLKGFLPICASCKKVRDDKGRWTQIESYIQEHSEAELSHGICPDCARRLYPQQYKRLFPED